MYWSPLHSHVLRRPPLRKRSGGYGCREVTRSHGWRTAVAMVVDGVNWTINTVSHVITQCGAVQVARQQRPRPKPPTGRASTENEASRIMDIAYATLHRTSTWVDQQHVPPAHTRLVPPAKEAKASPTWSRDPPRSRIRRMKARTQLIRFDNVARWAMANDKQKE